MAERAWRPRLSVSLQVMLPLDLWLPAFWEEAFLNLRAYLRPKEAFQPPALAIPTLQAVTFVCCGVGGCLQQANTVALEGLSPVVPANELLCSLCGQL